MTSANRASPLSSTEIPVQRATIFPYDSISPVYLGKFSTNAYVQLSSTLFFEMVEKISFRWTDDMIDELIKSLQSFKTIMNYRGLHFDGDKSLLYSYVRKDMATIYEPEDVTLFGPVENTIVAAKAIATIFLSVVLIHLPAICNSQNVT